MTKNHLHSYEETIERVLAAAEPVGTEKVPLANAAGRVLAKPIRADRDLPPFNRSERDGWAVRSADLAGGVGTLRWDGGVVRAGEGCGEPLLPGSCVRIMTGAPLPEGADAVVMVEESRTREHSVDLKDGEIAPMRHVHEAGVDARKGDELVPSGVDLTAGRIAVGASVGAAEVVVRRRVRVSVIVTGDEIVPCDSTPAAARIRDGNGPAARAALGALRWVEFASVRMAGDDVEGVKSAVGEALERSDALLLSGGVSMGDRDHVPEALERSGVKGILHKAAIRPGKPFWFGAAGGKIPVFGLPGNPFSFQVTMREIALVGLRRLAGFSEARPADLLLPSCECIEKKLDLRQFLPGVLAIANGRTAVKSLPHHGSGDFVGVSRAAGVLVLPEGPRCVERGELVVFHSWSLP
ncbi:MAG: molybdopterin molybdotransferase MoeA [Candidatus Eisenbacteria bacterium]